MTSRKMLEELSNEILLDLFQLFNLSDLFHAFHNLNSRFNQLLSYHLRFYSLDFRSISKDYFDLICREYLSSITHQITSLCLSDDDRTPNQPELFLPYRFTFDQFEHLKTLSLYSINSWKFLTLIIYQCRSLQYLTHLNIINQRSTDRFQRESTCLINNIWSLSKLTHCNLTHFFTSRYLFEEISVFSLSIKYLSIEDIFDHLNSYHNLFDHTPNLQQFKTNMYIKYLEHIPSQFVAPLIVNLTLSFNGKEQSLLILFKHLPNLSHVTLEISDKYWDGYYFEKLLTDYVPNIIKFRFLMSFTNPICSNTEEQIMELLDSFRTPFWLDEHQWFVRCHYGADRCACSQALNIMYTLPYAFQTFRCSAKHTVKSTCPIENDYFLYNRVRTVYKYVPEETPFIQFPSLCDYSLDIFSDRKSWTNNLLLNKLTRLSIGALPTDITFKQLMPLINNAPHLFSLIFPFKNSFSIEILQTTNPSIRLLDFQYAQIHYLNHIDCVNLVNSPLGHQCEYLSCDIIDQMDILYLINHLPNLRSLTINHTNVTHRKIRQNMRLLLDKRYQWLYASLPLTCSISRSTNDTCHIRIWISNKLPACEQRKSRSKTWSIFTKCISKRNVS